MQAFILQDWTTIRAAVAAITQPETDWLDLGPFQDAVFWIDCRETSTTPPTLFLQTAPSKDDSLFQPMVSSTGITLVAQQVPTVMSAFMTATPAGCVPLARYLRWQLTGTGTWDTTFRVVVAANAPGLDY